MALSLDYLLGLGVWLVTLPLLLWLSLVWRRSLRRRQRSLTRANLALSLWLLLVCLTGCELYFAFLYDQSDSFNRTNVSQKWFARWVTQKPLIFTGREGIPYRDDRDFPKALQPGQQHVVFVGDSFTFGHGIRRVEDRFSNRVRAAFDQRAPNQVLVTNIADAGKDLYWVSEVADRLATHRLPVTTLVYVLCLNDIESFDRERLAPPAPPPAAPPSAWNSFVSLLAAPYHWLVKETYFLNFVDHRLQWARVPRATSYYADVEESYQGPAWQKMFAQLLDLRKTCRDAGIDLRVVVFPFLHNLGPNYPFIKAHEQIVAACQQQQIPCLDLLPVLQPHARENLTVSLFDAHPNERAHALVAPVIADEFLADLWNKPGPSGTPPAEPEPQPSEPQPSESEQPGPTQPKLDQPETKANDLPQRETPPAP